MSTTCPSFHFVHIPKAGGTTVEQYLHRLGCEQGFCQAQPPPGVVRECRHMPAVLTARDLPVHSLAVVRDPFERFLSVLNHNWALAQMGGATALNTSFDWFGGTADDFVEHFLAEPSFELDCHLLPQWMHLLDRRGRTVRTVLSTHNLSASLRSHLAQHATRAIGWSADMRECARTVRLRAHNAATWSPWKVTDLSVSSMARVRRVYRRDIELARRGWDVHTLRATLLEEARKMRLVDVPPVQQRTAECRRRRDSCCSAPHAQCARAAAIQ